MKEASEEGICLVVTDGFLHCPVYVVLGEPEEIVVVEVNARAQ